MMQLQTQRIDSFLQQNASENLRNGWRTHYPDLADSEQVTVIADGVELAHYLESVEVFDRDTGKIGRLAASECGLDYRHSRFKGQDAGRFVIFGIRLELMMHGTPVLEYPPFSTIWSVTVTRNPTIRVRCRSGHAGAQAKAARPCAQPRLVM